MQTQQSDQVSVSQGCPYHEGADKFAARSGKRPPVIKSLPVIGPVKQFTGDVVPFINETRKKYGNAFRLRMLGYEMTCLSGPDAISLLATDEYLNTTKSMIVMSKAVGSRLPMCFDGPQHGMYRKMHSGFLNRGLERTKRDEIVGVLGQQSSFWKKGQSFDVLDEAQSLNSHVLSQILNCEPLPFSKEVVATVVNTLFFATYGHVPMWMALNNPKYVIAQKRMNHHFRKLVRRVKKDPDLAERSMIGQYLKCPPPEGCDSWDEEDLKVVPLIAYLAGYDTVASAVTSLTYQLLSNPDCLEKVREEYTRLYKESNGSIDPMKQKYLRACFQEAVRITPPGPQVIRYATKDFEFEGYTVREGDEVLVQIAGDHMDEELFPNPEKFDPERFLGEETSKLKRHILPFGSGAHRCTGASIGPIITQEIVSHWVNHYDLEITPKGAKPKIVSRPFTQPVGLKVKVVGKRSFLD